MDNGPSGGGGVSFNGTNTGYIQLSNNMSSTILSPTGFTICAWVDPNTGTNPDGNYYDIFGDKPFQFGIWSWGGSPSYFGVGLSENYSESASAQQSFYSNSWSEVCGVQSVAGLATIYVDGLPATMTNQNTGSPTIPTFPAGYIGTDYGAGGGGTDNFNGLIGAIRIYQRMLDAQEIAGMYKDGE